MGNYNIEFSTEKNSPDWRLFRLGSNAYRQAGSITLTIFFFFISTTNIWCQPMQVGIIDFYGPRSRSTDMELKKCLPIKENTTIQMDSIESYFKNKEAILDCFKLTQPKFKNIEVSFICCADMAGKYIMYVGVDSTLKQNPERIKTNDIKLPSEIARVYDSLDNLIILAIQHGEFDDDWTNGHSLFAYLPLRKLQEKFIPYADANLNLLREVLKTSKYAEQRAMAASVIAYHHNKAEIINDLLEAVTDADQNVRNNATRAIGIIAWYTQGKPDLKIEIPADPFITMMNSILWTDRNKGVSVLHVLSGNRDEKLLSKIKDKALESLIDMANWKSDGHSYMGYLTLGRIAGWKEEDLNFDSFKTNKSEMMKKMLSAIK